MSRARGYAVFSAVCRFAAACAISVATLMLAADEQTTVYKIQSHWQQNQHLHAGDDGCVRYGSGDDASYHWTLDEVQGYQRIRNVATGQCITLVEGGVEVALGDTPAVDTASHWLIDTVTQPRRIVQHRDSGLYLDIERQQGHAQASITQRPDRDSWWSAQWRFVHVDGPLPPPMIRRDQVSVTSPAYGATIEGDTTIDLRAPGLTQVTARSWQQGGTFGRDSTVATVSLDTDGNGSFVLPADEYPNGPLMVRLAGANRDGQVIDNCYLQLYNASGVAWNQGLPDAPPQAQGMALVFADDFSGELSISARGQGTTYTAHKPGGGDFSGIPFTSHENPERSPFARVDNYLRIRADANKRSTGLISSLRMDGTGITANAPAYFECRFIAQSAPGTWPAFWAMTQDVYEGLREPADELDVIEAYGGEGRGNPNQRGYWVTTHYWNQGEEAKLRPRVHKQVPMTQLAGGSSWADAFHTYAVMITETDTVYYFNNIEVARHPTGELSKSRPLFFFINFAIGGISGWRTDLYRYGGVADMYVDYVRVYSGAAE